MAIASTGTQQLKRTTNNPTISACTLMAWTYFTANGFGAAMSIGADDAAHFYSLGIGTAVPSAFTSVSSITASSIAMPLNTRFNHQAMVVSGTGANNVVTYFNGTKDLSLTADATTSNAAIYFQNDTGSDPSSCYISEIKIYNAILTADEIRREMLTIGPFRKLGLNSYLPCLGSYDAGIDHSGYGRNFTVGGTYTSQADFLRAYRNGPLQVRMPDRWLMGSPPAAKPKGPFVTSRPDLP